MTPLYIAAGVGIAGLLFAISTDASAPLTYTDSADPILNYGDDMTNLSAFLALIREGESSDDYNVVVGGTQRFASNLPSHPFDPALKLGLKSLRTSAGISTACGAYQATWTTWQDYVASGGAKDFSDSNQDAFAVWAIKRRGAYADVVAGRAVAAAQKLRNEWQMFTLSRWSDTVVAATFADNGGVLA